MFFWNSLAFSMIQQMLAIWSLVPLPFLNPAWTSGSSWFTYYWSLAGRILSITLLACEMSTIVHYFKHFCHGFSLGLEWKLTCSSPVATAEFSNQSSTRSGFSGGSSISPGETNYSGGRRNLESWLQPMSSVFPGKWLPLPEPWASCLYNKQVEGGDL